MVGLKGKERECRVTPLGSSGSQKEAQITKVRNLTQQKYGRVHEISSGCTSYNEVTFDTLYKVTSQFVLNPPFSQQKEGAGGGLSAPSC